MLIQRIRDFGQPCPVFDLFQQFRRGKIFDATWERIAETKLGGKKAFSFAFIAFVPNYKNHIYTDVYWVRVDTNRVVEVELSADSDEKLVELRKSLSGFTIKRSYSK